jgi:hypothetical protein
MPTLTMLAKQIQQRMGQTNVRRWVDHIMPLLTSDGDLFGVEVSRRIGCRSRKDRMGARSSKKEEGTIKILLQP